MSPPKSVGGELLGIPPFWSVGPNWFNKRVLIWYNIFLYIIFEETQFNLDTIRVLLKSPIFNNINIWCLDLPDESGATASILFRWEYSVYQSILLNLFCETVWLPSHMCWVSAWCTVGSLVNFGWLLRFWLHSWMTWWNYFGSCTTLILKILVLLFGEVFPLYLFVIIWNSPKGGFVRPLVSRL